jgi:KaiC/GvpD/RAD55 family RecA-like ATPase
VASEIEKTIENKLGEFLSRFIVLIITSGERYLEAEQALLRILINKRRMNGIYITFNRPHKTLKLELESQGINYTRLFFIDTVTESTGIKVGREKDCYFVSSPKNLKELSILLEQALNKVPKESRFVFIDSISTMLIYNDNDAVIKFIHELTGKMRLYELTGIIFFLEKRTNQELVDKISQFCDRTITLL